MYCHINTIKSSTLWKWYFPIYWDFISTVLWLSVCDSCTSFIEVVSNYFVLFDAIANGTKKICLGYAMLMYKSAVDFSILILQLTWTHSLVLTAFCMSVCMCMCVYRFLRFSSYKIILSVNNDNFTSIHPIWMSFITFNCLIAWIVFFFFLVYIMFAPTSIAASGSNDVK